MSKQLNKLRPLRLSQLPNITTEGLNSERSKDSPINGWNNVMNSQIGLNMDSPPRSFGRIPSINDMSPKKQVSPANSSIQDTENTKFPQMKKLANHRRNQLSNIPKMLTTTSHIDEQEKQIHSSDKILISPNNLKFSKQNISKMKT